MSDQSIPTLHESVEAATGAGDQRLLYGIGVPFLVLTAMIIGYALDPSWYFLVLLMASILGAGAVVIWGILRMLSEEERGED